MSYRAGWRRVRTLLGGRESGFLASRRAKAGAAAGMALMVFGAAVAVVGADAPDPVLPIHAAAVLNADNSTTITLNGQWQWPTHKSDCNTNRYAVGWAIDWNDPNQPGNPIAQVNGQGPVVDVGTAAANQYNPADNATHFYTTAPRCGVYDASLGYNKGNWGPMTHTYAPGVKVFSPCVVTYDIHGTDSPNSGDLLAGGPNRAKDNSVEKNGSTPLGNGCFSGLLKPDLAVDKTAPAQVKVGDTFTYGLVAKNTGVVTVAAPVISDIIPADLIVDQSSVDSRCAYTAVTRELKCTLAELVPGATAPAVNLSVKTTKVGTLTNTATITPDDETPDDNHKTVTTDVVDTPVSQLSMTVDKTNDANTDGTYSDTENAKTVGQKVSFQLVVTNTSPVAVVVDSISDAFGSTTITPTCSPNIVGTTLAAKGQNGDSATCTFDVDNYGPAKGATLTDTATVNAHESGKTSNKASASDTSTVGGPGTVLVSLTKTNDANQDGVFTDSETAKGYPQDVVFQLHIQNPTASPLVVGSLTDQIGAGSDDSLPAASNCPKAGDTLAGNADITCTFTMANYAPNFGDPAKVNTAKLDVHEVNNPGNHLVVQDTSTVNAAPLPVLQLTVDKTNDANNDGTYSDKETAGTAGQSVVFHAVVTNKSAYPVVIDSMKDEWPGMPAGFTANFTPDLVDTTLAPNESKTVTFTIDNYAPATPVDVTDTVTVTGHQENVDGNTVTGSDTSTVTGPAAPVLSLEVNKLNDANNDGTYTDNETAASPNAAVKFQATVKNTSDVAVTINTVTDEWDGQPAFSLATQCPGLIGRVLQPGDATAPTDCQWTQANYAPPVGQLKVNTVRINGVAGSSGNNSVGGNDTTTVGTAAQVLPAVIVAPAAPAAPAAAPAALPRTGRNSFAAMLFGGLLFLAGAVLIAGSDPALTRGLRRLMVR